MEMKQFENSSLLGDKRITSFISGEKICFKAVDFALELGYVDTDQAIRKNVCTKYMTTWNKLNPIFQTGLNDDGRLPYLHPNKIFVQEFGLYERAHITTQHNVLT